LSAVIIKIIIMKKFLKNLKFITLAIVAIVVVFVNVKQAEAAMVYTTYPIQYIVTDQNLAPSAYAGGNASICLPSQTSVTISNANASDSDGTIATTAWDVLGAPTTPTITPVSTSPGTATVTLPTTFSNLTVAGTYVFRLTATDNDGAINTDVISITVNSALNCPPPPDKPDLVTSAPTPATATGGSSTTYTATVSNVGLASTMIAFPNLFHFDHDTDHSVANLTVQAQSVGPLATSGTGSMANISATYTFPTSISTGYVRACADFYPDMDPNNGLIDEVDNSTNSNCSPWTAVTVSSSNAPVVTISASPSSGNVTISGIQILWSATNNPTECEATAGNWDTLGTKPTTGPESQSNITSAGTYTYTLRCKNVVGWGSPASATIVATDETTGGPVDGQCSATHYGCTAGANIPPLTGINKHEGTGPSDPWTWTCPGKNGGASASCSEVFVPLKQCDDDVDNDSDGKIDEFDPGCHTDGKVDPANPLNTYNPLDDKEKNISPIWIEI